MEWDSRGLNQIAVAEVRLPPARLDLTPWCVDSANRQRRVGLDPHRVQVGLGRKHMARMLSQTCTRACLHIHWQKCNAENRLDCTAPKRPSRRAFSLEHRRANLRILRML